MTVNEVRDRLAAEHPGNTVSVSAHCWHHVHWDRTSRDETEVRATIHTPDRIYVVTTGRLDLVIPLMRQEIHPCDEPVEVDETAEVPA